MDDELEIDVQWLIVDKCIILVWFIVVRIILFLRFHSSQACNVKVYNEVFMIIVLRYKHFVHCQIIYLVEAQATTTTTHLENESDNNNKNNNNNGQQQYDIQCIRYIWCLTFDYQPIFIKFISI
ncbi:hypothetical protein ACTA71_003959 [Dictyostelium dimigraforme]